MKLTRLAAVLAAALAAVAHAQPGTTAFTYQGHLTESGAPADGTFDMRFKLFEDASSQAQVAVTLCLDNVQVTAGLFTVELDFGRTFVGEQRWLQIEVRRDTGLTCASAAGLTVLSPRQELTPAPWCIFAADSATLGGQTQSFYRNAANLQGTLNPGVLTGTYTAPLTLNNPSNIFAGNGSQLTALAASNLSGTVTPAHLPSNVVYSTTANIFANTNTFNDVTTFNGTALFNGALTTPVRTRTISLPAHAFHIGDTTESATWTSVSASGLTAGTRVQMDCGLVLPQGAIITQVEGFVVDNDTSQKITLELARVRLDANGFGSMALVETTLAGASTAIQTISDTSIQTPTVDNSLFGYYLRASWTTPATFTNINFRGARVTYTTTTLE